MASSEKAKVNGQTLVNIDGVELKNKDVSKLVISATMYVFLQEMSHQQHLKQRHKVNDNNCTLDCNSFSC